MDNTEARAYETIEQLDNWETVFNAVLRDGTIDEFALLVDSYGALDDLESALLLLGWEKFNRATDRVKTFPVRSGYSVEYHFFRHPAKAYRLEVMKLDTGTSPLHTPLVSRLRRVGTWLPVHASFKCASEEDYMVARYALLEDGWVLAQQCESTYGRFSYFTNTEEVAAYVPYLKPRVNTRDGA